MIFKSFSHFPSLHSIVLPLTVTSWYWGKSEVLEDIKSVRKRESENIKSSPGIFPDLLWVWGGGQIYPELEILPSGMELENEIHNPRNLCISFAVQKYRTIKKLIYFFMSHHDLLDIIIRGLFIYFWTFKFVNSIRQLSPLSSVLALKLKMATRNQCLLLRADTLFVFMFPFVFVVVFVVVFVLLIWWR